MRPRRGPRRVRLSADERRALGVILGLLLLASLARWLDRPRPLLDNVPVMDVAAVEEASRAARPPPRGAPPTEPLDANTATARDLERLPGIGPAVAARIIAERERAPYTSLAELQQRVPGVGPALAARMAPYLTLPAGTAVHGVGPGPGAGPPGAGGRLELNRASARELEQIPGVGPVLAARLVARRDSLHGFRDWDQVDAVPGVGPAMLQRLKDMTVLVP